MLWAENDQTGSSLRLTFLQVVAWSPGRVLLCIRVTVLHHCRLLFILIVFIILWWRRRRCGLFKHRLLCRRRWGRHVWDWFLSRWKDKEDRLEKRHRGDGFVLRDTDWKCHASEKGAVHAGWLKKDWCNTTGNNVHWTNLWNNSGVLTRNLGKDTKMNTDMLTKIFH